MFTDNHISQDMTKFMTKVQFIFDQQLQKQFHSYDLPNIDIQQFITNNPHLMDECKKLVKELPKERIPFDFLHFEKGDDIPERDLIPFINLVISGYFNFLDHCLADPNLHDRRFRNFIKKIPKMMIKYGVFNSLNFIFDILISDDPLRTAITGGIGNLAGMIFIALILPFISEPGLFGWFILSFDSAIISLIATYIADYFYDKDFMDSEKIGALILPGINPGNDFGGLSAANDNDSDDDHNDNDPGPGSPGAPCAPGGVEFRNVQIMNNINIPEIILSQKVNLFFNADNDSDVIEAFNSLCLSDFKNKTLQNYFETICREISDGIEVVGELPFISLHFNDDHLLYSVMNSYYKNTLVGNILTFMDYFLKGFVNGGFFDVDFVYNWVSKPSQERITDLNILNQNLILVKKSLKKVGNFDYHSLHELIDDDVNNDQLTTAFRIIGEMCDIGTAENILFTNESFNVEYDIHPNAHMQKEIATDETTNSKFGSIIYNYNLMKNIVKYIMSKVPEFRGFFTALDMITFAIHYISNLNSIGKTIDTSNSFQSTAKNTQYVRIIPEVFPPLPVSVTKDCTISFELCELVEYLKETCINKEMENLVVNNKNDFSPEGKEEILNKIEEFYRGIVSSILNEDSHNYDDQEIQLNTFLQDIITFFAKKAPPPKKKNQRGYEKNSFKLRK